MPLPIHLSSWLAGCFLLVVFGPLLELGDAFVCAVRECHALLPLTVAFFVLLPAPLPLPAFISGADDFNGFPKLVRWMSAAGTAFSSSEELSGGAFIGLSCLGELLALTFGGALVANLPAALGGISLGLLLGGSDRLMVPRRLGPL